MNTVQVVLILALVTIASGEPPVLSAGYGYRRPSSSHIQHSIGALISGGNSHGGGFTSVGGFQSNEGQYVDPQLLHKIKEILLEQEQLESSNRGHHSGGFISSSYGAPSDSYGPPSSHYGVPYISERVVGIDLGHVNPAIQVAHFHQQEHHHSPSISYGLPAIPSGSYGVPSSSYGVPAQTYVVPSIQIPSGSYGTPSDVYGSPHH